MTVHRKLIVGYHKDALEEQKNLVTKYPWLNSVWDPAMADVARMIRGPAGANYRDPEYFGREGEQVIYPIEGTPQTRDVAAYAVVNRLDRDFFRSALTLIPSVSAIQAFWRKLLDLVNLDGNDPGDQQPHGHLGVSPLTVGRTTSREELWKSTISFRRAPTRDDIEVCVSFGVSREKSQVVVRILLVEEIAAENRQFTNIWRNGGD